EMLAQVMKIAAASGAHAKDILVRVARAYLKVKRPDDARDAVDKANARAPLDPDVKLVRAELALALGNPAEALRLFLNEAKYYRKDPERLKRVQDGLARVFESLGAPELANDADLIEDASRGRSLAEARERAARL